MKNSYVFYSVLALIVSFFFLQFDLQIVFANSNSSVEFDGINDYLVAADSEELSITKDFTIEYWVKFDAFNTDLGTLVAKYGGPTNFDRAYYTSYYLEDGVGKFESRISNNGLTTSVITIPQQLVLERWYHVVFVYSAANGQVDLYLAEETSKEHLFLGTMDGHLNSIKDTVSRFMVATSDGDDPKVFFDGKIDDLRVWNDVRTKEEIDANFGVDLNGNEESLVAYWKFDNSFEDSINNNDFTNYNGASFSEDVPVVIPKEPEDEYPLYTQIESPYPSVGETSAWADDVYASGAAGRYACGSTIGGCGCAITSLVMTAQNAGIDTSVAESEVTPGTLNEYLQTVGGYNKYGNLYWLAAQAFFGELRADGKLYSRFTDYSSANENATMAGIDAKLATPGAYAVLGFDNGHFVWLPAKTETSYTVRDPWWYGTETAADTKGEETYMREYNNSFDSARFIKIADEPRVLPDWAIEAYLTGTGELLFQNAAGTKVGYTDEQGVLIDLDSAWYTNTAVVSLDGQTTGSEGKHLLVADSTNEFTLTVIGTEYDEFTLEFLSVANDGTVESYELTGVTYPGVETIYTVNLETGVVTESEITQTDIQNILQFMLAEASPQQQKFFAKQLEKLYGKSDQRTVSQTVQQIAVLQKLFMAKKIASPLVPTIIDLLIDQLASE